MPRLTEDEYYNLQHDDATLIPDDEMPLTVLAEIEKLKEELFGDILQRR